MGHERTLACEPLGQYYPFGFLLCHTVIRVGDSGQIRAPQRGPLVLRRPILRFGFAVLKTKKPPSAEA